MKILVTSKDYVQNYLQDLHTKIKVFDIIIERRAKNLETLAELEIPVSDCKKIILQLTLENYYRGPTEDKQNNGEYWEFGIKLKHLEVYIKINYGKKNNSVICISFHKAEFKIEYPYKLKEEK